MSMWRVLFVALLCALLTLVTVASAGDDGALTAKSPEEQAAIDRTISDHPNTYGTQHSTILQIPSAAFTPYGSSSNYISHTDGYIFLHASAADQGAFAPVNLPNGAQIRWLDIWYYDTSFVGDGEASLYVNCGSDPPSQTLLATVDTSGTDDGYGYNALYLPGLPTVDNSCQLFVYVTGLSQDSALQFRKIKAVDIWYRLQISPAPAVQSFPDVNPGFWAFREIEALADSGITTGFPDGTFRPTDPVTRAQMATFLARALGLHWPG